MANFNRRVKSDNAHLAIQSGAALNKRNIVGPGTFTIGKEGSILKAIIINTTAASPIIIRDGSTVCATMKASLGEGRTLYDFYCQNGIKIDIGGASDITVTWAP